MPNNRIQIIALLGIILLAGTLLYLKDRHDVILLMFPETSAKADYGR